MEPMALTIPLERVLAAEHRLEEPRSPVRVATMVTMVTMVRHVHVDATGSRRDHDQHCREDAHDDEGPQRDACRAALLHPGRARLGGPAEVPRCGRAPRDDAEGRAAECQAPSCSVEPPTDDHRIAILGQVYIHARQWDLRRSGRPLLRNLVLHRDRGARSDRLLHSDEQLLRGLAVRRRRCEGELLPGVETGLGDIDVDDLRAHGRHRHRHVRCRRRGGRRLRGGGRGGGGVGARAQFNGVGEYLKTGLRAREGQRRHVRCGLQALRVHERHAVRLRMQVVELRLQLRRLHQLVRVRVRCLGRRARGSVCELGVRELGQLRRRRRRRGHGSKL
mmetsp:Transcript_59476/g.193984  ORF Transcript_59476/g.193984 Transcript_59476/m.193984 type:complete len:334 (-) Transcript_59476:261-1262(-)